MRAGFAILLTLLALGDSSAQASTRASLSGILRERDGGAIRGAQVLLTPLGLSATSSELGSFRFGNLDRGNYSLSARRLGYVPARLDIRLTGRDTTVELVLHPLPQTLTNVVASATRIGLNGIVLDSSGAFVAEAVVRAIPAGGNQLLPIDQRTYHSTRTDREGVFFLPLVSGGYELRVARAGMGSTSSPVYVPRTESRCVVVGFAFPSELLAQGRTCTGLSDSVPR